MSLPVFWRASLGGPGVGTLLLDGPEGHHAAAVRRLGVGERVRVTDGRGAYIEGSVVTVAKRTVEIAVDQRVEVAEPAVLLTVVQAAPKGAGAQLAVQALVEVGVDRLVPWAAERSQVPVTGEPGRRLLARWRAWALEAGKQARRSRFCELGDVASTVEVAALAAGADVALVLHEDAIDPLSAVPLPQAGEVLLVVGPEGGIGATELATLGVEPSPPPSCHCLVEPGVAETVTSRAPGGVRAVRLGDTVLRTSTAGAVAAGIVLAQTRWR